MEMWPLMAGSISSIPIRRVLFGSVTVFQEAGECWRIHVL
jgi:hypothetical protein